MFHDDKKIANKQTFSEKEIVKTYSAQELLSSISHTVVQKEIDGLVKGKNLYLYRQLTRNFAGFVQALPSSNLNNLGSILEEGLHRALYVLQIHRQQRDEKKAKEEDDSLIDYMLFSSALLFDVSKVVEDRTIFISTITGAAIKTWLPHEGPLSDQGDYYRIRRGGGIGAWLGRKMTPILAHNLMPNEGYDWIAKNPKILNIWLSLLTDDHAGAEGYDLLLKKAISRLMKLLRAGKLLGPLDVDKLEPEGTKAAEAFLEWLRKGLKNGAIKINERGALVYMTEAGLFLEIGELIKNFSRYNMAFTASQVYDQFKKLGFVQVSGEDYDTVRYVDTAETASETTSTDNLTKAKAAMFGESVRQAATSTRETSAPVTQSGKPVSVRHEGVARQEAVRAPSSQEPVSQATEQKSQVQKAAVAAAVLPATRYAQANRTQNLQQKGQILQQGKAGKQQPGKAVQRKGAFKGQIRQNVHAAQNIIRNALDKRSSVLAAAVTKSARAATGALDFSHKMHTHVASTIIKEGAIVDVHMFPGISPKVANNLQPVDEPKPPAQQVEQNHSFTGGRAH